MVAAAGVGVGVAAANSGHALCPSTTPLALGTPTIVVDAVGPPKTDLLAFVGGGGFIYQRDGKYTQWASERFETVLDST